MTSWNPLFRSNPCLRGVRVAGRPAEKLWDVHCHNGCIDSILRHSSASNRTDLLNATSQTRPLLIPSLCHPHIHLDKCFLLSHPKFDDLTVEHGDFAEALTLTNKAKARFEHEDLMQRGRALIEESIQFGVTSMRAFVEVDLTVEFKCLKAGLTLKSEFEERCHIQICVFAQDPLFSYEYDANDSLENLKGLEMRRLFEEAVCMEGVDAVGSTPYVEIDELSAKLNVEQTIDLAIRYRKHVDFHLDYNLDDITSNSPMVWTVLSILKKKMEQLNHSCSGSQEQTKLPIVTLGHCTRLTLFAPEEWERLRDEIASNGLQISFVGLPTSDIFMMGRPHDGIAGCQQRVRGTLQIPQMIRDYGFDCAIGINNVGNAFTPQGSCDPLSLASLGVGIYQAGSKADAGLLLECVSSRARKVIGLGTETNFAINEGDPADFVLFGMLGDNQGFRSRKSVHEVVHDPGTDRVVFKGGKTVSSPRLS